MFEEAQDNMPQELESKGTSFSVSLTRGTFSFIELGMSPYMTSNESVVGKRETIFADHKRK